jgi:pyruvate/2-oxoglutarate dehydrogenase complex dihydrolipoamide dehydrogenase (E3) component
MRCSSPRLAAANHLARRLGCQLRDDGSIAVDTAQATTVDRVYAAGNCTDPGALVPTAAGSGVTAAVAINVRLTSRTPTTRSPPPGRRHPRSADAHLAGRPVTRSQLRGHS